jgi:hypothetical protein
VTKWKLFLRSLEERHGLRVDSATHIWLIHHLFLDHVNSNIVEWAEHWNVHVMRLRDQRNATPRDMFLCGLRRRAARRGEDAVPGLGQVPLIDWNTMEDEDIVRQLQEQRENPFNNYAPDTLNHVPCEPPECPLMVDQVDQLDALVSTEFNMNAYDMGVCTLVWIQALSWCRELF